MATQRLEECYTVRGTGGFEACIAIQEKLQDHGLCSYTREDPEWPQWRFFYETYLDRTEALSMLGKFVTRYHIQCK